MVKFVQSLVSLTFAALYVSVAIISMIFVAVATRASSKRLIVLYITTAILVLAICAYFVPAMFAVSAGSLLALMVGQPIDKSIAYVVTSVFAVLACAVICLALQLLARFAVSKAAT